MTRRHFDPKLNKTRILAHAEYRVYSVNGLAVRNVARPDEEFGNFATTDDFPDLIPKGEIWISEKLAPREGVFFIANALTRLARQAAGATEKAEDDGLEVERMMREKVNGVAFRAYAKYFNRDDQVLKGPGTLDAGDSWDIFRAGFRADADLSERDRLTIVTNGYTGSVGEPNHLEMATAVSR